VTIALVHQTQKETIRARAQSGTEFRQALLRAYLNAAS
jgi:hypothetical protein